MGHEGKGFAGPEALPDSEEEVGSHAQLKHPLHQPDPDPAFGVQGLRFGIWGQVSRGEDLWFMFSSFWVRVQGLGGTGVRVWRGWNLNWFGFERREGQGGSIAAWIADLSFDEPPGANLPYRGTSPIRKPPPP